MKNLLRILSTPSCWIRNHSTDKTWDLILRQAMAKHKFEPVTQYTAKLGDLIVWVRNHPYCSFHPEGMEVLPRRSTVFEAQAKYLRDTLSN
jgi:hypothetical protein